MRASRHIAAAAVALAAALGAAACTGTGPAAQQSVNAADPYPLSKPDVTLKLWHGFSEGSETTAFNAMISSFEQAHPNIKVDATPNISDTQIQSGIKAGGSNAPDVAVSFTTDDLGTYCSTGMWLNLDKDLAGSGINLSTTFPAPLLEYTSYQGDRCALPLENDAYGLYYNKTEFAAAGVTTPPQTLSELQADALKLTVKNPDGSFKQIGFFPSFGYFESPPAHYTSTFGLKWQSADHKSVLATDPGFNSMLTWQHTLEQAILNQAPTSTQSQLTAFMTKEMAPGEFTSGQNPFETGKVAMSLDGEWRNANIAAETPTLSYGTAPFPVPDSDTAAYGGGYVTGTIIGIARTSAHQDAAWELVKYLTTNTSTLVAFANAIDNVPSTYAALNSPSLTPNPNFRTFVKISSNPHSATTPASPNGGNYQQVTQTWVATWEAGQVTDLPAALKALDAQIDKDTAAGTRPSGT